MTTNSGDKGTRNLVIIMVSFIVIVGVVFSIISNRSNSTAQVPAAVSEAEGYGIVLNPSTTPKIDVYIDYQCPACRAFEIINGGYLIICTEEINLHKIELAGIMMYHGFETQSEYFSKDKNGNTYLVEAQSGKSGEEGSDLYCANLLSAGYATAHNWPARALCG